MDRQQLSVNQRFMFILRKSQEPMIYGAAEASPELLKALVPACSDAHPQLISSSTRAGNFCLEWETSWPGHSVGLGLP